MSRFNQVDEVSTVIDSLHKTPSYSQSGIPMLRVTDIKSGSVSTTKCKLVDEQTYQEFSRRYVPKDGDIVITRVGSYGKVAYVGDPNFCLGQNTAAIVPKSISPRYLYYVLSSPLGKSEIEKLVVGSTQKTLSLKAIKSLSVPRHGNDNEKAIAHILGTLDDKIELNQEMNQTLEEIAKAIFKSWFVDFDPVRAKAEGRRTGLPPEISDLFPDELVDSEIGEIPKGWEVAPLDQIGSFRNGLALQKYPANEGEEQLPVVKIAQLRKGSTEGGDLYASAVPENFIVDDGDYIFSWSGSLMAKYWVGGKGALNQHLFKVEERTHPVWFIAGWVDQFMPEFQSIAASKATTMGHIKREHLKQAICTLPPNEILQACASCITPIIERSILTQQESKTLSELRDTLLPKLISGELRIHDAEKFLQEAGI